MMPLEVMRMRATGGSSYTPPTPVGAHRYWAVFGYPTFPFGGGNYFWNVAEMAFLDGNLSPVTSGSAISTGTFGGFPASNAFDGSSGSLASLNANAAQAGSGDCYIGRDFGSPVTISAVTLHSSSTIGSWRVRYSDNGTSWTDATPAQTLTGNVQRAVGGMNEPADVAASADLCARLVILYTRGEANSACRTSAAEIEFLVAGADQASGGTVFSSSQDAGFPASQAFDNNNASIWTSAGTLARPQHIGYQFASNKAIDAFSYTFRPSAGFADESPVELILQRGPTTSGPWTTIKWRSNLPLFSLGEKRTY